MSGVRAQCVVSPQDLDINPSSTPSASSSKVREKAHIPCAV